MSTLTTIGTTATLAIVTPTPSGAGGIALNSNFQAISNRLDGLATVVETAAVNVGDGNVVIYGEAGAITVGDSLTISSSGITADEGNFTLITATTANITNVNVGIGGSINLDCYSGDSPVFTIHNDDYDADVFTVSTEGYITAESGYVGVLETSTLEVYGGATLLGTTYLGGIAHTTGAGQTPITVSNPLQFNQSAVTGSANVTPAINITQTWNTTGNGALIKATITNTASYQYAKIIDIYLSGGVNSGHLLQLDASGNLSVGGNLSTPYATITSLHTPTIYCDNGSSTALLRVSGGSAEIMQWGTSNANITLAGLGLGGTNSTFGGVLTIGKVGVNASSQVYSYFALSDNANNATSGTQKFFRINSTYNQTSGSAANTDLLISRTQTAVGSGQQLLIDAQVNSSSKASIDNFGNLRLAGNLGVGNAVSATSPGSVVKKIEVFDASGTSLGYIPVYNSIS